MRFSWHAVLPILKENRDDIGWTERRMGESLKIAQEKEAREDNAIRSEEDFLVYKPDDLRWLAEQLGADYEKRWHPGMTPQEVADWMHILRTKLATEAGLAAIDHHTANAALPPLKGPTREKITITALVQQAKQTVPELESLPDDKAAALLGEVFRQVGQYIHNTEEGALHIDGLGKILVRQINQAKNGQRVTTKRALLNIAKDALVDQL
jgi:hypothetical protein